MNPKCCAEVIRARGHEAQTADLKQAGDTLPEGCDGVIVEASVHMGKHEGCVTGNAESYVAKFEAETGWRPAHVGLFAGALLHTHCGFMKKHFTEDVLAGLAAPPAQE